MARSLYRAIARRIRPGACVLEFGAGTGSLTGLLADNPHVRALHIVDRSPRMLARCEAGLAAGSHAADLAYECADIAELQLRQSYDVVCANAALQWLEDPTVLADRLRGALANGGFLALTTFGPATLRELRECYTSATGSRLGAPVHYTSAATLASQFSSIGVDITERNSHRVEAIYASPTELLHQLRAMGATPPAHSSARMSRTQFAAFASDYQRRHACPGGVRATWEVVLVVGRLHLH